MWLRISRSETKDKKEVVICAATPDRTMMIIQVACASKISIYYSLWPKFDRINFKRASRLGHPGGG